MPIVEVPSLSALGLIPFQLNPHYLDADPGSTHQDETRQQRLEEFLEENDVPVLGLREDPGSRYRGATPSCPGLAPGACSAAMPARGGNGRYRPVVPAAGHAEFRCCHLIGIRQG
jgi:dipeptidase E